MNIVKTIPFFFLFFEIYVEFSIVQNGLKKAFQVRKGFFSSETIIYPSALKKCANHCFVFYFSHRI